MCTYSVLSAYVGCEASLAYFKAWIMKFHRNCEVLTIAFAGIAIRLWVEATTRP